MPPSASAQLASIRRGSAAEAVIRGHVAVVDAWGGVLAAVGDPFAVTTVRSCVKPLQAQPFVHHALDEVGATPDELAITCASHAGEPIHVETVRRLLARAGLDEEALSCGPQMPSDDVSARELVAGGGSPRRVHNNCSGKHAGMLATCVVRGWPVHGYAAAQHPIQAEVRAVMGRLGGLDLGAAPVGIDGCGLPTFGVPLATLSRMFAAASAEAGFRRCQDAMADHPYLVAGRGRFDTALLEAAGRELTVKGGGAAVWVAVRRPDGPAVAIKLEAGDATAMPTVAMAALDALGWLGPGAGPDDRLARFREAAVRNWGGEVVGTVAAEPGWTDSLRS